MNKIKTNIVTKLLLCVMLLCALCGALFLGAGKKVSVSAEATAVEYKDLLGLEDRTSWGACEGGNEYYFGGVTLEPFGYFNTSDSVSGCWCVGNDDIITDKSAYAYSENKADELYYYEDTDISGTLDIMNCGNVTAPNTTCLRVGNWTDDNGNLFMSTAFKNVHWQDHASTAADNFGCDIMEYIYINGQSARAISTQNGMDRKYGGSDEYAFPFSYGGVFAPIDVVTDVDSLAITIMNEYIEAEGLVVVLKAGFRIKAADGGMLYLSEDFVYPYYKVSFGEELTVKVGCGETVAKPADPTKESSAEFDYTFEGWYLGDTKWDFENDTVTENITLTARYTETTRKYTITFNVTGNDAVTFAPVVVAYGETYDLSNLLEGVDLSKHTCTITSGGVAVTSVTVLSDVTVDVTFKARVYYTVTINGVDYQIELGEKLQKPTDPTKDSSAEFDYIFDGWYNGDEKWDFAKDTVTGAINLVAKYKQTKRKYTISFNVLGNDKLSLGSVEVEYGQVFDLSKVLEGLDISGYTYSFSIGGSEKINFKVVENVTVDVSFRQLVENAKDKGKSLLDKWQSIKNYVNNLQSELGCSSGIASSVTSLALAVAATYALKKKKDE